MSNDIIPIIVSIIVAGLASTGYLLKRYHFDLETNLEKKKELLSLVILKYISKIRSGTLDEKEINEIQDANNLLFMSRIGHN